MHFFCVSLPFWVYENTIRLGSRRRHPLISHAPPITFYLDELGADPSLEAERAETTAHKETRTTSLRYKMSSKENKVLLFPRQIS